MTDPRAVTIRDYRTGDAPAMARIYFLAVHALGTRRYTQAQVTAWAPDEPDPDRFVARAADGRRTLVAVDSDGAVIGVPIHNYLMTRPLG
ncbi:putative acetyltransferase [Sphingomonas palmae]|uniref:Putative acetyltransferase n=1 Tax=Sphingomonas palmae TaxID=1855283 RepID=A0A1H7TC16_9SPHN|nr:hypothetical protein [Sphingomonas palmae]SEL81984.1 putative acetyltransferase [Sphingomonas palmae]